MYRAGELALSPEPPAVRVRGAGGVTQTEGLGFAGLQAPAECGGAGGFGTTPRLRGCQHSENCSPFQVTRNPPNSPSPAGLPAGGGWAGRILLHPPPLPAPPILKE